MATKTFDDSLQVIGYLQSRYGSADYRDWQSLRKQWYSYVNYPVAGQSSITFFGTALGGATAGNRQLTNIPKAGSFGQNHFLLKSLRLDFFINDQGLNNFAGTDATTLFSEFINGIFQAGVITLNIGQRPFVQLPMPFLYAPPGNGEDQVKSAGIESLTLAEGTPNTLTSATVNIPYASLLRRNESVYLVDPGILIEAEQNFDVQLDYPSGVLPAIATGIINNDSNPLYVGVSMDGVNFRPLQ